MAGRDQSSVKSLQCIRATCVSTKRNDEHGNDEALHVHLTRNVVHMEILSRALAAWRMRGRVV